MAPAVVESSEGLVVGREAPLREPELRRAVAVRPDVEGDRRFLPFVRNLHAGPRDVALGYELLDAERQGRQACELELDSIPDRAGFRRVPA